MCSYWAEQLFFFFLFPSERHQTSLAYGSQKTSALKAQLCINPSKSQVVYSFQVQIQLVWSTTPSFYLSCEALESPRCMEICSFLTMTAMLMDFTGST